MAPQSCVHRSNLPVYATLVAVVLLQCVSFSSSASSKPEAEVLMKFRESLGNKEKLSDWNAKTAPCTKGKPNWIGIVCRKDNVWGIHLDNMGLFGKIDVDALTELENLRGLSFINNNFDGPFPKVNKLKHLKSIYFSGNKFSGELDPKAFQGMELIKVQISNNQLSGSIPSSLASLKKLADLQLDGNKFTGEVPNFDRTKLKNLNLSNNQLKDSSNIRKLASSDASGSGKMQTTTGAPGTPCKAGTKCPPPSPPPSSSPEAKGLSKEFIIGMVIGIIIIILLIVLIVIMLKRKPKKEKPESTTRTEEEPHPSRHEDEEDEMEKGSNHSYGRHEDDQDDAGSNRSSTDEQHHQHHHH